MRFPVSYSLYQFHAEAFIRSSWTTWDQMLCQIHEELYTMPNAFIHARTFVLLNMICHPGGYYRDYYMDTQCYRKCKILARLRDHLWLMVGWSVSVLGSPPINNLLRPRNQSKKRQNGPNGVLILLRHNGHFMSVHLWNRLSTFIPKHFLQNLKNPLVAKRTIYGKTLGRPVG